MLQDDPLARQILQLRLKLDEISNPSHVHFGQKFRDEAHRKITGLHLEFLSVPLT